jgi:hypothetical protein
VAPARFLSDLIGGQILFASMVMTGQVLDLHRSGKLRVLAVTAPAPVRGAPDFPTATGPCCPRNLPAAGIHAQCPSSKLCLDSLAGAFQSLAALQQTGFLQCVGDDRTDIEGWMLRAWPEVRLQHFAIERLR